MGRTLSLFAVVTLILGWGSGLRAETQLEAVSILEKMLKTYATAPAFSCEGSCDDHEEGSALPVDHRTVTMRFVRPDRFRLAWTQRDFHGKSGTSVIYMKEGQAWLRQWGMEREEAEPSLGQVIDSCAGISLGLSYLVPALLLGDPGYLSFTSLRRLPDGNSADGRPCWKLAGETAEGARWELLIDHETNALREALEINALPAASPGAVTHAIRTQYRFTDIRFADTLPESVFADTKPAVGGKKR